MREPGDRAKTQLRSAALAAILLGALLLRVIGSDWGFPLLLHPDEWAVTRPAISLIENRTLDPDFYGRPNHLSIYMNALAYLVATELRFDEPAKQAFARNLTFYTRLARLIPAFLGTLCVLVAYLIGREFHADAAVIAAFLFAFFPSYVVDAHYAAPDVPLVLYTLLVVLFLVRYLGQPSRLNLLLSCVFAALAVAEKYPGALTCLAIAIAVLARVLPDRRRAIRELCKAGSAFLLFLFLCAPYLYLRFSRVLEQIVVNAQPLHLGADGLGWQGNLAFYVAAYLSYSGIVLLGLALVGGADVARRYGRRGIPLFAGLLYWLVLAMVPIHMERWALPMYITPLLLACFGVLALREKLGGLVDRRRWILTGSFGVLLALSAANLVLGSLEITAAFTLEDTRVAAYRFAWRNGISPENSRFEGYTPFKPARGAEPGDLPRRQALRRSSPASHAKYLILSSYVYQRYLNEPGRYAGQSRFYHESFTRPLVKEFAPCTSLRPYSLGIPEEWSWLEIRSLRHRLRFLRDYLFAEPCYQGPVIRIHELEAGAFG